MVPLLWPQPPHWPWPTPSQAPAPEKEMHLSSVGDGHEIHSQTGHRLRALAWHRTKSKHTPEQGWTTLSDWDPAGPPPVPGLAQRAGGSTLGSSGHLGALQAGQIHACGWQDYIEFRSWAVWGQERAQR